MLFECTCWMFAGCLGVQAWHFWGVAGWRLQEKESFKKSGLAIFSTEIGKEWIVLLSQKGFTSDCFQHCQQASSCFGAGTWIFLSAENSAWMWRHTFFFHWKIAYICGIATFKLVEICKCWGFFSCTLWDLSSSSVFLLLRAENGLGITGAVILNSPSSKRSLGARICSRRGWRTEEKGKKRVWRKFGIIGGLTLSTCLSYLKTSLWVMWFLWLF